MPRLSDYVTLAPGQLYVEALEGRFGQSCLPYMLDWLLNAETGTLWVRETGGTRIAHIVCVEQIGENSEVGAQLFYEFNGRCLLRSTLAKDDRIVLLPLGGQAAPWHLWPMRAVLAISDDIRNVAPDWAPVPVWVRQEVREG